MATPAKSSVFVWSFPFIDDIPYTSKMDKIPPAIAKNVLPKNENIKEYEPDITNKAAPNDAPLATPKVYGVAIGFLKTD